MKQIEMVEKYVVVNDSIDLVENFNYLISDNCKILYEVIRVKNSVPIFFENHLERLRNSMKIAGFPYIDGTLIKSMILKLLESNPVSENNIRISIVQSSEVDVDFLIYFILSRYPTEKQISNGVTVRSIIAHRDNPNVKIENKILRKNSDDLIRATGCYEVILVNEDHYITEGSRSNLFFLKNNMLITPPNGMVLGGITRQMVIGLCKRLNIHLKEELISIDNLSDIDEVFITGTSPGILPVCAIDNHSFNVGSPIVKSLIKAYNDFVQEDIKDWKLKHDS